MNIELEHAPAPVTGVVIRLTVEEADNIRHSIAGSSGWVLRELHASLSHALLGE